MQVSNFKSEIFSTAWKLFKTKKFISFAAALKLSWAQYKTVTAMKSGVVSFSFKKVDGSIREAQGTRHAAHITVDIKGTGVQAPYNICKYFDLEKKAFRSYRIENLVHG
jgi:hypothetical protein